MTSNDYFVVGGSLPYGHPTYIKREADREIYSILKAKEYCYVLNSRQMGKSSLRVRTMKLLSKEGFQCVYIYTGNLGNKSVSAEKWYGGLVGELWRNLNLTSGIDDDFVWWQSHAELYPPTRFSRFIEDVLLTKCSGNIIIFLDEVDNIIGLDFRDEILNSIRACYEKRLESIEYCRLTFCLLGVVTPYNLKLNQQLNSFDIGKAIQLAGFKIVEAQSLISGLANKVEQPEIVLQEILNWTKGQPFLTQKICSLVVQHDSPEPVNVEGLIQRRILNNWESQDEPAHLKAIRDRLLSNRENKAGLLTLYGRILTQPDIAIDNIEESVELCLSGLVSVKQGKFQVSNPIYEKVFNQQWIENQLAAISPYQNAFAAWLKSERQDLSRLLQGKALEEGLIWGRQYSTNPDEQEFLQASEKLAKKLARKKVVNRFQLGFTAVSLLMAGLFYSQYRQVELSNTSSLIQSSKALYASNQKLDSLIAAIETKQKPPLPLLWADKNLAQQGDATLQQVALGIREKNRLLKHTNRLLGIAISQDGKLMATVGTDNTVRLWKKDKKNSTNWKLYKKLTDPNGWVVDVAISSDGQTIASASQDAVKLWNQDDKSSEPFDVIPHTQQVTSIAVRDNRIITGSEDGSIQIWEQGKPSKLIKTFSKEHNAAIQALAVSSDGKIISASEDKTLKILEEGKAPIVLEGHIEGVRAVTITNDNTKIISGSRDKTLKIWNFDGTEVATLRGHLAPVYGVVASPDNNQIVSASGDNTLKIWDLNEVEIATSQGYTDISEIATLQGHTDRVWDVAYTSESNIASVSWDETIRIWQPENELITTLSGHQDVAIALDYNTGKIASTSDDKTVKLWNKEGKLLRLFGEHSAEVFDVAIHNQTVVSVGADKTLKIWKSNDSDFKTINIEEAHQSAIWAVDINPDGKKIVTAGDYNNIKIWDIKGNELQTSRKLTHEQKVWDVAISPENNHIASASEDHTVKIWDMEGNLLHIFKKHQSPVRTLAYSNDGNWIVSGDENGKVIIWQPKNGEVIDLGKHDATVKGVAISPNNKYLASVDGDGKISLWKNNQGWQHIKTLEGHDSIWSVVFTSDNQIATAGEDAKIILWNLAEILEEDFLDYGCNWLAGYLEHSEEVKPESRNMCN